MEIVRFLELFVQICFSIDKRYQKPLSRAVPVLDRLLAEPLATLRELPVVIGPGRRHGSVFLFALATTLPVSCGGCLGFVLSIDPNEPRGARQQVTAWLVLLLPIILFLFFFWTAKRWFVSRGDCLALTPEGAVFHRRGVAVYCPWGLFDTPGNAVDHGRAGVIVPVAPEAVAQVEVTRDGSSIAQGIEFQTTQVRFRSKGEIQLRDLYEVSIGEIAPLLLQLGRTVGIREGGANTPRSSVNAEAATTVDAVRHGRNGWLTVRLSRLVFPSRCCSCSMPTTVTRSYRSLSSARVLSLSEGRHVDLQIPFCKSCQAAERWSRWRAVALWSSAGLAILAICLALAFTVPKGVDAVVLLVGLASPFVLAFVGLRLHRRRHAPVELGRLSPGLGTVDIRFKRSEYVSELLRVMQEKG